MRKPPLHKGTIEQARAAAIRLAERLRGTPVPRHATSTQFALRALRASQEERADVREPTKD